ncbi:MAG: exodeoxyribonuclease VII large subunit [Anaerolineae bacterium]|nr:exodeoxyribonuclease VII large subunit [Anaerolineales bacterium]MCQ3974848.1 exodeoxyribonuclease VII large subunit [Anaerolineae bacterium]
MQPLFDFSPRVLSVSAINAYIRRKLEADLTLQDLWLEGEISNWKPASSGHIYFTLKDAAASLRCVVWRSQTALLSYLPRREGEAVLAHGRVSVYEAGGNYQFYVDDLQPAGQGALYAQFERIKARLAAEGLFEADLKQSLPSFPQKIGLVTSPTGAALRDILNVLRRRYPLAQVILAPAQVQGETAPLQLIAALGLLIRQQVDVIILARGGGSLEDLWAFNDEALARAIAACPIPLITGIGHETDFTIADFVADVRAPTPSAAAELATPDRLELQRTLYDQQLALAGAMQEQISSARSEVKQQAWALARVSPQAALDNYRQRLDTLTARSSRSLQHQLLLQQERVKTLAARLETLNPQQTLARGYAIVQKGPLVITQTAQVNPGDALVVKVKDGAFEATAR